MFTKAREIAGTDRAAFDIGYQSILHREFGYWQKILVRFFSSPRRILRRLNLLNARLNSTKVVELVSDSPWHAVVRWHWTEGAVASKDICLYNQGIYSAIPTVWDVPRRGSRSGPAGSTATTTARSTFPGRRTGARWAGCCRVSSTGHAP